MIHYHGIAGVGPDFLSKVFKGRHVFVSYAAPGNLDNVICDCSSFALDNGAFTHWRKGMPFDFTGYREWAEEKTKEPNCDFHLTPDVIDGDEMQNRKLIEGWSVRKAVPVWHMHESLDFLYDLCHGFPKVAIGSSGQYASVGTKKWWGRMDEALRHVCEDGVPPCFFHGLRMLRIAVFTRLPFHSADSTTVVRDSKYDQNWPGYNAPKSKVMRGLVIAERLESHQAAARWVAVPKQQNLFF